MSFIVAVQCDPVPLLQEHMALKAELRWLQGHKWSLQKIKDDDSKTKFILDCQALQFLCGCTSKNLI